MVILGVEATRRPRVLTNPGLSNPVTTHGHVALSNPTSTFCHMVLQHINHEVVGIFLPKTWVGCFGWKTTLPRIFNPVDERLSW